MHLLCWLHVRSGRLVDLLLVLRYDLGSADLLSDLIDHDRIQVTTRIHIAVWIDHLLINVSAGLLWIGEYLADRKETV